MLSRRYAAAFIVCIAAFSAAVILYHAPRASGAETPPPACDPKLAYDTVCGRVQVGKDGKPTVPEKRGGVGCKCIITDKTSGKSVPGICDAKMQCTGGDKPKDAENRDAKQCLKPEDCPSTGSPGGGAPGGGAGGDPKQPQPDTRTPEQKRIDEAFKALQDPKPDEKPVPKPDENAVKIDKVITEEEYLKQCPTCKPFSEIGKGSSLVQQAFGNSMVDPGSLKTTPTDKQPSSIFSSDIANPSNISKIGDGLGTNAFTPQPDDVSNRDRIDVTSTFEPVDDLGGLQDRQNATRVTTPGNPTMDVSRDEDSGLIKKLTAKNDVDDQQWDQMVKTAQREMAQNCPSGYSCIMVNNEMTREMTVHYSKATAGNLPEGASVLTPNQDKLGSAGGVWSSLTGGSPTSGDVASVLQKEGAELKMPDGKTVTVTFNEASAKVIAPSIADTYDPTQSSWGGRVATATGFGSDKIAEGDFVARNPDTPKVVETQIVTETPQEVPQERPPTRIYISRDTPTETTPTETAPETRQPTRVPVYVTPTPNDNPPPPATPPATPPGTPPSTPPATPPAGERPPSEPPTETPSTPARPQQQANNDANLIDRLYCWIFTCQSPQQQAQPSPSMPSIPSTPPQQTPPQQVPSQPTPQRPIVVQVPPTQTPPTQTPPTQTPPSNTPPNTTPSSQTPTTQTPPAGTQPATTPPTPVSRTAPTQLATNNGVSNVAPPSWTQPATPPAQTNPATGASQPTTRGIAPRGDVAPTNGANVPANAASAPRVTNPVAINNAAARLVQQATAQANARSSAPSAAQPVNGDKTPTTLAVDKSNETVPATAAAKKTDVAVNNPNAGGTAGEPLPRTDTTPRKAELAVAPGPAGKVSDKQAPPSTPNPEVKRPTDGPSPTGKIGTGGSGTGNGTGLGNGNGSEAGIQAPSTCGVKCLAQKALSQLVGLTGITPANATPAPTMTVAEAQKQVGLKVQEVKAALKESEKAGRSLAALEHLRAALQSGREAAEIANQVNDPTIKEMAGDLNKKVLDVQRVLSEWDNSRVWNGTAARAMNKMETQFPKTIPAAGEALTKLNDRLNQLASAPPSQNPGNAPLTGQPQPASRTPGNVTPNNQPPALPAARKFDNQVASDVAPGKRAYVYANVTNPATAKVVYGMYGIGGSIEDTMDKDKNNIGKQVRNSNCNCVLVVPDTGNAPGRKGGSTAGALANSQGANDFDQEMNETIARATGLPKETVAKMNRQIVFHSGGFQPAVAMVQAIGKKIDSIQALDGMYGNAPQVLAEWKKNNPDGTLTSLCAALCDGNQQLENALKAGGVPVNNTPGTVAKGATVARGGNDHFGVMTNGDPVKQFLTQTGTDAGLPAQPQPASRAPANNPLPPPAFPRVPGNIKSKDDSSSVAQQVYAALQQQGIKPADLTRGSPNYSQAWKGVVETTRQALDARGMLHPQLDLPAVLAVARQETDVPGNRNEFTSTTGVRGYMQVTGDTAVGILGNRNFKTDTFRGPWEGTRSFARENNIGSVITGMMLMNQNLHSCGGNVSCAGQTYNSGAPNSCSGKGCVNGVPTYGPAVARDTQVMRQATQACNGDTSCIAQALNNMAANRSRLPDARSAYASILTGAELGPLMPVKCDYQGCAATPTIEPGNRGYSAGVNRVAQAPSNGLYYSDPHTGAIGVPSDPNMTREQFIRAAREDVAMERLAQQGKLPQGSAFQNFKATRSGGVQAQSAAQIEQQRKDFLFDAYNAASHTDNTGPFGWKDEKVAQQSGRTLQEEVIGGMNKDFRERLFNMIAAAKAEGVNIGINSGYRGDPRQALITSGVRAGVGRSNHGGSRTGGWGTGRAADVVGVKGTSNSAAWAWIDRHPEYGLSRIHGAGDPPHVEAVGTALKANVPDPVPTYDITNANGDTVARNVPLPDGTVGQNGEVRLLSNKDGLPMNAGGEPIKDGESPLKISSDQTLPKADADGDGLKFKDERPAQPRPQNPWAPGGEAYPYPRSNPFSTSRPTSTCVDNNGQLYGCTPTGGSNPTGGTSGSGGGGGAFRPSQVAQQYPRQYPIQTPPPYPFPRVPVIPPPVIEPSLSPSLSCSPSSVPYGTSTPVTVQWSCLTGSASSTGFATGGIATGRTTMTSSRTGTTTLRFLLQCVSGARIGPIATCSVPVVTPPAPLVSLSVDPNPVNSGGSAIVIWGSSNATSCSLKATSTAELIDGSVNGSTSTMPLFMNTPITLTCKNAAGITASSTIQIRVRDENAPSS